MYRNGLITYPAKTIMTKIAFIHKIMELNESLPENHVIELHIYKEYISISLENKSLPYSERTLYADYSIKFNKLDNAMKHLQIEIDTL